MSTSIPKPIATLLFLGLSITAMSSPAPSASSSYYLVGDVRFEHNTNTRDGESSTAVEETRTGRARPWPGGRVPYTIPHNFPAWLRDLIQLAMTELQLHIGASPTGNEQTQGQLPVTCVQFTPRRSEPDFLTIKDEGSCHSTIGHATSSSPVLSVSPSCARLGAIKHQLMHVLGFSHEQDRPDRDAYLDLDYTNMDRSSDILMHDFDQLHDLSLPYDFESIMHLGPYTGAKNPRLPVMTPKPEYAAGVKLGQAHALSPTDVLRVQRLYGCREGDMSMLTQALAHKAALFACDFQGGICGMSRESRRNLKNSLDISPSENEGDFDDDAVNDFNEDERKLEGASDNLCWAVILGAAPDGPAAGRTNGLDPYLYVSPRLNKWAADGTVTAVEYLGRTDHLHIQQISGDGHSQTDPHSQREQPERELSAEVAALLLAAGGPGVPLASASWFTPRFLPSEPGGKFCVEFQLFQTDNYGGLTVVLHSARSGVGGSVGGEEKEEVVEQLERITLDGWTWVAFTVQGDQEWAYMLEFRAAVGGGSVALDDIHIADGECL
ncbi:metalloendopeptidase [Plakobranchus ocellatus]|uniref:Metalloendopeptidase n=1 Tax=Plakobranchus ocellatus TaxID=259542 RepID=A0AAV4BQZ9_9GAST|nr:metalloendopeptidase [Plakobranchus ocellatus]